MLKGEDRMSNRTRQNNKGVDRKVESNDSPEIPHRGDISEPPASHRASCKCDWHQKYDVNTQKKDVIKQRNKPLDYSLYSPPSFIFGTGFS